MMTAALDLATAAFALAGSVIGGLVALAGIYVEQRHAKQQEAERRAEAKRVAAEKAAEEARIAARILQGDLEWAKSRITNALRPERRRYWDESYALSEDAWFAYREVVASDLSDAEWATVRDGFRGAKAAELQATVRRNSDVDPGTVTVKGAKLLKSSRTKIKKAIEVLAPQTRIEPVEEADDLDEVA